MSNITIIRASVAHVPLLTAISMQSFYEAFEKDNNPDDFKTYTDEAFSEQQITKDVTETGSVFFLAYINNEAAGYARVRVSSEVQNQFPGKKLLELHRLYSLKRYIGKGLGKALMNHCLAHAKQNKFDIVWLGVWEHNLHAQKFYTNFGFEKFSSHIFMVGTDPQTDYLLKKNL